MRIGKRDREVIVRPIKREESPSRTVGPQRKSEPTPNQPSQPIQPREPVPA